MKNLYYKKYIYINIYISFLLFSVSNPKFGLLTNPSIDIVKEIKDIYDLGFDYTEIGIEVPEGNRQVIYQLAYVF
jgi:hypothetical protein